MLENKTGYSIEKKIKKVLDEKRCTNIEYLAISHKPVHPAQDLTDNFLGQLEITLNFEPHGSPVYVANIRTYRYNINNFS
jgi:hypothetical protein